MTRDVPLLLYIMGDSRSGSTILDALLGSLPGVVATGELNMLLLDDFGVPRQCACARSVEACPVWGPVLQRWGQDLAPHLPQEYLRLQERFTRFRGLPRLMRRPTLAGPSFQMFARWTVNLYRRIAEAGAGEIVAESSKNPVRAMALLEAGLSRIVLIHLVRDPRGVAWSKRKLLRWRGLSRWLQNPPAIVLRAAVDWVLSNLMAEATAARYPDQPYVRIRYEDLAADPAATLGKVGDAAGLDLSSLGERASRGESFDFGHIMAGNLARQRGPRPVSLDIDWQVSAPAWIRWTVWAITGWIARRYGFRRTAG